MMAMAEPRRPGDTDMHRRQRAKNLFVFGALLAMCAVFFVLTIVRMGDKT
jgi:hypothetical protein